MSRLTPWSATSASPLVRQLIALAQPPRIFVSDHETAEPFFEFFLVPIRNKHTRRAYYVAVCRFGDWLGAKRLTDLLDVEPTIAAAYFEKFENTHARPSVKQHLAAVRKLFDYWVTGGVLSQNPVHAIRGPAY